MLTVALIIYTRQAIAQTEATVIVSGATGTIQTYSLTQLQAMPSVSGYGGFYQTNQRVGNSGLWIGVSVLYLCNQVGGISQTSNITVSGQGNNSFTYDTISNGLHFNDFYKTYDNITGLERNQTQPLTLMLAYLVNGTALPSSSQPAPRLVVVGPEGLLMDGSGGRSVMQVSIVTPTSLPTPSPTQTPTQQPTPIPTQNPTLSPTAIPSSPTPTAVPTQLPTSMPTSTITPTPIPANSSNGWPIQYIAAIALAAVIIIIVVAISVLRKK